MIEVQFRGLEGGTIDLSTGILTARWPQLRGSLCLQGEARRDRALPRRNDVDVGRGSSRNRPGSEAVTMRLAALKAKIRPELFRLDQNVQPKEGKS